MLTWQKIQTRSVSCIGIDKTDKVSVVNGGEKKVSVEFQRRRCVPQNCACVPSPAAPMVVSCVAGLKPGMVATIIPGVPWVQDKNIVVVTGHIYSTSHAIITKLAVTCTGCLGGNEKFTSNLMVFEQNMYENEIKEIQTLGWTLCQIPFDTLLIKLPEPQTSKYFHLSHCCLHSNIPSTYITTMAKLMRAFIHEAFYRDLRNIYFFSFPSISRTLHSIKKSIKIHWSVSLKKHCVFKGQPVQAWNGIQSHISLKGGNLLHFSHRG